MNLIKTQQTIGMMKSIYMTFSKPRFSSGTADFTQVVWKNTTKLGCAASKAKKNINIIVVCNYNRPGNYLGGYEENVFPENGYYDSDGSDSNAF